MEISRITPPRPPLDRTLAAVPKAEVEAALTDRFEQFGWMMSASGGPAGQLPTERDLLRFRRRPPVPPKDVSERAGQVGVTEESREQKKKEKKKTREPALTQGPMMTQGFILGRQAGAEPNRSTEPDTRSQVRKLLAGLSQELLQFCRERGASIQVRGHYLETRYSLDSRVVEIPEGGFVAEEVLLAFVQAFDHALGGDTFASRRALLITSKRSLQAIEQSNEEFFGRAVLKFLRQPELLRREDAEMYAYLEHLQKRFAR